MHSECVASSSIGVCCSETAAEARARSLGASLGGRRGRRVRLPSPDARVIDRVDAHIRRHALIEPRGEVLCLVSGGADSTCLFHALRELGYRVSALHVDHGLRGAESDADAAWCAERLGAEVVEGAGRCRTEAELRDVRYSFATDRLRATGHTLSDQVETILYRLVSSGSARGIKAKREDGVVRPLLCLWRDETRGYCESENLPVREDT